MRRAVGALALAALLGSCTGGEPAKRGGPGESCTRAADCAGDLRCVELVCVGPDAPDDASGMDVPGTADAVESPDAATDAPAPDPGPDTCQPSCQGKTCGGDGCGGSCGDCPRGADCLDGICATPDGLDCAAMADCVLDCAELSCAVACLASGSEEGRAAMEPLVDCVLGVCEETEDAASCLPGAAGGPCLDAYLACVPAAAPCGFCPPGTECGVGSEYAYVCGAPGCAPGLDLLGSCAGAGGNTAVWCEDGWTLAIDCDHVGPETVCGWHSDDVGWICVPSCTPDCAAKACGDDGCGGSCGDCPNPTWQLCHEGQCQDLPDYGEACGAGGGTIGCGPGLTCQAIPPEDQGFCTRTCDPELECLPYYSEMGLKFEAMCLKLQGQEDGVCFFECTAAPGQPCPDGFSCVEYSNQTFCYPG